MKFQHTAGSWRVSTGYGIDNRLCFLVHGANFVVANAGHVTAEESEGNAHLIAAAPAMLEALRIIASQSIGDDWTPEQAITFVKQHAKETLANTNLIIRPPKLVAADVEASDAEYFSPATTERTGSVMMQDIVGDYATPEQVSEWRWVEKAASFNHARNGVDGIWEFVLNLSRTFTDIPTRLQSVIAEARNKNLAFLVFHQGT